MRIFGLLVLLCALVSVGGAVERPRQSASSQAAAASFNSDLDNAFGIVRSDSSGLVADDREDWDHRRFDPARDGELTCYTIESYRVKRQSPDSDVVEPAGHSTCQRASKYSVKAAVEPGKAPSH
jgi:hypothetical protein